MHPRFLVTRADEALVDLWRRCRAGGLGGAGPLPEAGGVLDQAAYTLAALDVIEGAVQALRKTQRDTP